MSDQEYQANSFCKHINCDQLEKRLSKDINTCEQCKAYQFHDYLQTEKYQISKKLYSTGTPADSPVTGFAFDKKVFLV